LPVQTGTLRKRDAKATGKEEAKVTTKEEVKKEEEPEEVVRDEMGRI